MSYLQTFNWFDLVLAIIMVGSVATGLRAGFARVVVGLAATLTGLMAAFWCHRLLGAKLHLFITSEAAADALAFFLIFVGVVLLGAMLAALLSRLLKWVGLSWFNHVLGGAAGLLRGALIVAVLAEMLVAFAPSPMPRYMETSKVLPYANEVAAVLAQFAPQQLKDAFLQQMENMRKFKAKRDPGAHEI